MKENSFVESLVGMVPRFIDHLEITNGELIILANYKYIVQLLFFLKYHTLTQYKVLIDLCGVDYPTKTSRFEVVYNLLSISYNSRIRIKVPISQKSSIPSVTQIYSSANWAEREAFDLFGIFFTNHPDLRRLLTDYGFKGHPLRKDFPLSGYFEIRYDDEKKRIVSEPIEISQEFRKLNLASP